MAKVIPRLGTISMGIGKAPFQFAPTNAVLHSPYFLNGSGGFTGVSTNGYFGLQFMYGSIPKFNVATYAQGALPVQMAGGTINSFGVFEYKALLSNPAVHNTIRNWPTPNIAGLDTYAPIGRVAVTPNAHIWPLSPEGATDIGESTGLAKYAFPSILFENISTSFQGAAKFTACGTHNLFIHGTNNGLVVWDVAAQTWVPLPYASQNNGYAPYNYAANDIWQPGVGWLTVPVVFNGGKSSFIVPGLNNVNTSGGVINPLTGVFFTHNYNGNTTWVASGNCLVPANSNLGLAWDVTSLSEPADDALIQGGANAPYQATICPGGNILLQSNGSPTVFFLIAANLSGYWRINMAAKDSATQAGITNCQQIGMDLNGNIWVIPGNGGGNGTTLPTLYSTVNLSRTITWNALQNITFQGIGCKRLFGNMSFPWEG